MSELPKPPESEGKDFALVYWEQQANYWLNRYMEAAERGRKLEDRLYPVRSIDPEEYMVKGPLRDG